MLKNMWLRAIILGFLVTLLGVPPQVAHLRAPKRRTAIGSSGTILPHLPKPRVDNNSSRRRQASASPATAKFRFPVESNLVNVDVVVTDQDGDVLTGLNKNNFRISDDGPPQQITNFAPTRSAYHHGDSDGIRPQVGGYFGYKAKEWSYPLLNALTAKDWVAWKTFSMRTARGGGLHAEQERSGTSHRVALFSGFQRSESF